MSTQMTLFANQPSAASDLLKGIKDDLNDKISGSEGNRRISFKNNVFTELINGKAVRVSEERSMQVVIISAAPVSRTFYMGTYTDGAKIKPTCWSSNTQTPDASVPENQRQSSKCRDCPQDIKGSAPQGEGRACRFSQRLAVVLADPSGVGEEIYQVNLPATSVFGDADGQKMPLQAYGRYLKAHNTHVISVVTEMKFDPTAQMKLVFKPIRPLTENELRAVLELRDHPDTIKAVTMSVSQMDSAPEEAAKPKLFATPAPAKAVVKEVEDEVIEEPKKVVRKAAAVVEPSEKPNLADLAKEWGDD